MAKRKGKSASDHQKDRQRRAMDAKKRVLSDLMLANPYKTQRWYAHELGIPYATVCRHVASIYQEWRAAYLKNYDQLVVDELMRLDKVERDAEEGWKKSQRTKQIVTKEQSKAPGWEGAAKVRITTEEPAGDPKFLEVILRCRDARRKILGLDAPVKVDARVQIEQQLSVAADAIGRLVANLGLTEDQMYRLAQGLEELQKSGGLMIESAGASATREVIEARIEERKDT